MEITTIEFFRVNYFYEFVFGGEIKIIDGDNNDRILSIKNYFYECFLVEE